MIGLSRDYDADACSCPRNASLVIEPFKVSNTRTELRCRRCGGLLGWWDDDDDEQKQKQKQKQRKLMIPRRDWTLSEAESLR